MGQTRHSWTWAVALSTLLLSAPAAADALFSLGAGPYVETLRWKGPGELDPAEITLSDTGRGAVIPMRVTWTQDQSQPRALGVTAGFTFGIVGAKLGQSTSMGHAMLELLGRVAVHRTSTWSLQLGAGGTLERPLAGGQNGVLSNDNVEPFETMMGGVAAVSVTLFRDVHDYTFDLRSGVLFSEHLFAIPVLLTASMEWGRDRPAGR